ncbi:MAG TPA: NAD(P)H-hydrate dehydratase [Opitutaceae bacterium]|nr:NAD(P)H-hydrate dehydratase [Opitutaceae bacterium]
MTCKEAAAWEGRLLVGGEDAAWEAMRRAGAGIGRAIEDDARETRGHRHVARWLVLSGKGHNGGDAMLAAAEAIACDNEAAVTVCFTSGENALRPLALRAWETLKAAAPGRVSVVDVGELEQRLAGGEWWDVAIDGIFGMQFRPPLGKNDASLLRALNEHAGFGLRAAVDLPSGLGAKRARTVFRADFTYAPGIVKAPVVDEANRDATGRLRYIDIGFFDATEPPLLHEHVITEGALDALREPRPAVCDKRSFGHLLIVAGSAAMPGAALMATLSALRSGVGLVTACVPDRFVPTFAARAPEAMWIGLPDGDPGLAMARIAPVLKRATAILAGPGIGPNAGPRELLANLLRNATVPVVLDADALHAELLASGVRERGLPTVLTPHAGEFARLRGRKGAAGSAELMNFARKHEATCVLKGPLTRLSDGTGVWHSVFGGPVLARGGSGDVLAGLIAGRVATGAGTLVERVAQGVAWHGLAADSLARTTGATSAVATDLLSHLAPALHERRHV